MPTKNPCSRVIWHFRRFGGTILLATLLLLPNIASATPAAASTRPPTAGVRVGDIWVYEQTDGITGKVKGALTYTVIRHTDEQVVMRVSKDGDARGLTIFDANWNLVRDGPWHKKPNDGTGINGPLKIGSRWHSKQNVQNLKTGKEYEAEGSSKIEAMENIRTKAGAFNAFKIVTEIDRGHSDDPTLPQHFTITTWYAPAVNLWVKRTIVAWMNGHLASGVTMVLTAYPLRN